MKTQKEKIALLNEKLCKLCDEEHPDDDRHAELEDKCGELVECLEKKENEIGHLKRSVATGRMDGTGTDYKAELAKARKDRGDANRSIKKMEKAFAAQSEELSKLRESSGFGIYASPIMKQFASGLKE